MKKIRVSAQKQGVNTRRKTKVQAEDAEKSINTTPLLSLDIVYHVMLVSNDIKLLKNCRFVSRAWNDVCCRVLRKTTIVEIDEDDKDGLEEFKQLIVDRHLHLPPGWPNPFQSYRVVGEKFTNQNFVRFIHPPLPITCFELTHSELSSVQALVRILLSHKNTISTLEIVGDCDKKPFITNERLLGSWPSLKKLTLTDKCNSSGEPCAHMKFVTALVGRNELVKLALKGQFPNISACFVPASKWSKLEVLDFEVVSPPNNQDNFQLQQHSDVDCLKLIATLQLPSLKEFTIWFDYGPDDLATLSKPYSALVVPLVQRYISRLEILEFNFFPLSLVPSGPKLSKLCCVFCKGDRFESMTTTRFPALTNIHAQFFWMEIPPFLEPESLEPHEGVHTATVNFPALFAGEETLFPSLRSQFPKLSNIWIQQEMTFVKLFHLSRLFPGLKSLDLSNVSEEEILGTMDLQSYIQKGWPAHGIRNSVLLSMNELEKIIFPPFNELVTADILIHCLAEMKPLKSLHFHWNGIIPLDIISGHLAHLEEIVITYHDKDFKKDLLKFKKKMSIVKLSYEIYL